MTHQEKQTRDTPGKTDQFSASLLNQKYTHTKSDENTKRQKENNDVQTCVTKATREVEQRNEAPCNLLLLSSNIVMKETF